MVENLLDFLGDRHQEVEFKEGKSKLVIEIGHAAPTTLFIDQIVNHLNKIDANYLGVDFNPWERFSDSKYISTQFPWAADFEGDFGELQGFEGKADEVWVRNLFKIRPDRIKEEINDVLRTIFNLLKPGGKLIYIDNYTGYRPEDKETLRLLLESLNFEVVEADINSESHPFIAGYRDFEQSNRSYKESAVAYIAHKNT